MLIIREHDGEEMDRICHVTRHTNTGMPVPAEPELVGIDEDYLAWIYIAPGYEDAETSRKLLHLARTLIGPDTWAVVQAGSALNRELLEAMGLSIVESYENQASAPSGINVHLIRTV